MNDKKVIVDVMKTLQERHKLKIIRCICGEDGLDVVTPHKIMTIEVKGMKFTVKYSKKVWRIGQGRMSIYNFDYPCGEGTLLFYFKDKADLVNQLMNHLDQL